MTCRCVPPCAALTMALSSALSAQVLPTAPVGRKVGYVLDSGPLHNPGAAPRTLFAREIAVPSSAWMRLHFSDVSLAPGSALVITSAVDAESQVLDAATLQLWSRATAYFNGDTLLLELVAAPGSAENRVAMTYLEADPGVVPSIPGEARVRGAPGTCGICGSDERTPSSQAWAGRLMPVGCTASIFCEDSTVVSAGHCMAQGMVVQFNVPPSTPGCAVVHPSIADQFPVTLIHSQNLAAGADWAILSTGVNTLGQSAYERQRDLRRFAQDVAATGQSAALWGYGMDTSCTRTQTQQFSPGDITGRTATTYRFSNDIRNGSSGSALVVAGRIVGVVTHCNSSCTNTATRHDVHDFTVARNGMALCDDTYTISIASEGAVGIPVGVTPVDASGAGDGVTPFSRTYTHFTPLALTAPTHAGDACFTGWTINGAPVETATLAFTVTGAASAIARYAPCCGCDWNRSRVLDSQDLFEYLDSFFAGTADFDRNGATTSSDFFAFLACFFAGC